MKKRKWPAILAIALVLVLAAAAVVWFSPARFNRLDAAEVESIRLFSGQTGQAVTVTDADTVAAVCDALGGCTLKPDALSLGYTGYTLRVTVTHTGGGESEFIVNSESLARRDPFFYKAAEGSIDLDYLLSLTEGE